MIFWKWLALLMCAAIVVGMLTVVASVMVGAISVGNLWLLPMLALYAAAFWVLADLAGSL